MSEIYLTPFSPSLGSALAKALTQAQYREIDRGMKPPMTQQEAVDYAAQTNPTRPSFDEPEPLNAKEQEKRKSMYRNIDSMKPRDNRSSGQREFEFGNSVRGSLGPQNRLIQERNRSPISNISRDVGSAARRGMDRAASSLAPMADAARQRFSDAGQSMRQGAQAAGEAMGRAGSAMGATASNVASQIPGMADAARRRFNQTSQMVGDQVRETGEAIGRGARQARQAIGQGARQAGQAIGQGATQARDAMNRGAMNVASKIPGMARAAGRMVGTAGRKVNQAARSAIDNINSERVYGGIREAGRAVGQGVREAEKVARGAGTKAKDVADTSYGVGQDIAGQAMKYGARGGRALGRGAMNVASRLPGMAAAAGQRLMGLNNPMGGQQPSGSGGAPFGNNKTSESEAPSGGGGNEGYTPPKRMMDALYQQNIDRSQTRGGIGTGLVSNLLTGGLSGLARGAYNARQRNLGRQNLQNLRQYGADAVPFLRSEYETMNDRSIIRSRMTTEAIRNAYVF